jgi:hypothetical protein
MNLFEAYLTHALPIAAFHAFLFITCVVCFYIERRLLRLARESVKIFKESPSTDFSNKDEFVMVIASVLQMSEKGELLSPEALRVRLSRSLDRYDGLIRYSLNAFVISGLLGTLYNLWKLGPAFWSALMTGQTDAGQPSIGIAFSASVFGLTFALLLSLYDSFRIRQPREKLLNEASSLIFDEATRILPPREGAAVAQALENFYHASEGFLTKLKLDHEKLSHEFIEQIKGSSTHLTHTLDRISKQWETLTTETATRIEKTDKLLVEQISSLASVTEKIEKALDSALPELEEARKLSVTLLNLRKDSELLQNEITNRLGEYGKQWSTDLVSLTQKQADRLESCYTTAWSRYEKLTTESQTGNTKALEQFSASISTSVQEWKAERDSLTQHVNALVTTWRSELAKSTTGISAGLGEVTSGADSLTQSAKQLQLACEAALQQLQTLQSLASDFSGKIVEGTPLGSAITEMNSILREIKSVLGQSKFQSPPNIVDSNPQSAVILDELHRISTGISQLQRDVAIRSVPTENRSARKASAPMYTPEPKPSTEGTGNGGGADVEYVGQRPVPGGEPTVVITGTEQQPDSHGPINEIFVFDDKPSFFTRLRKLFTFKRRR